VLPELLEEIATTIFGIFGPGTGFTPPARRNPPGYLTHITIEKVGRRGHVGSLMCRAIPCEYRRPIGAKSADSSVTNPHVTSVPPIDIHPAWSSNFYPRASISTRLVA